MHNPTIFFNVLESLTQHLLFIIYAQIVILPTYLHGYLLLIFYHICQRAILPTYFHGFRSDNH